MADVSAIGLDQTDESKTIPNPNVVFELGYAVAHLGWERVILLVNEVYGPVEKLPFDFDRNRASPFRFARDGVGSQKGLTDLVKAAVGLIIEKDPPRPKAGRFDAAEARRERDLTNLRWILESIHWPTVDDHIETGAKFLSDASVSMNDAVNAIRSSSTFHVNDEELKSAFRRFVETWNNTMRHDHYIPRKRGRGFVFKHGEHPREYAEGLKDFEYMEKERLGLHKSKKLLLTVIRDKFPEVDIQVMSDAAGARYDADMARLEQQFESIVKGTNIPSIANRRGDHAKRGSKKRKDSV